MAIINGRSELVDMMNCPVCGYNNVTRSTSCTGIVSDGRGGTKVCGVILLVRGQDIARSYGKKQCAFPSTSRLKNYSNHYQGVHCVEIPVVELGGGRHNNDSTPECFNK